MSKASAPKIRLGVIGCGSIAYWHHLRNARQIDGAVLVASSDPDAAARKRAEELTGINPHATTDELLERGDVDAVIISGPTHLHEKLAIGACAAGKHIYLEKPLATSAADGARVVAASNEAGVKVMLGFNRRFHPAFQQARDILASGKLGKVRAVQSSFCEPASLDTMPHWKRRRETGGGVLLDLAPHHIDLTRWFLQDEVARVTAALSSELSDHDSARLELTMAGGAEVQGWFSSRSALADWFHFACDGGTLRVDRHNPRIQLRVPRRMGYGVRDERVVPTPAVRAWRMKRMIRPSAEPSYTGALTAFVEMLKGKGPKIPGLADGMRAVEAIDAAEVSAATGTPSELRGV